MTRGRVPLCPERVPCIVVFRVPPGERLGSDRARACRYCVRHTHDDAMTGSRPERSAPYIYIYKALCAMTRGRVPFLPRAERFTLLCSPGRSALQQSALQFYNHSAAPMGHGVRPRQPTRAVATALVRQHEATQTGGRHTPRRCTPTRDTTRNCQQRRPPQCHPLSRFALSSLARRLKIPPGRSDVCRRHRRWSVRRPGPDCGPWCDPTLALSLRCGTAQFSGAPLRRF